MIVYVPMSCRILTPGHIKFLEELDKKYTIVVGLLTAKALKGYKAEIVPYKDRFYILRSLWLDLIVVPQDSLNPTENILTYQCHAIASGDGWEKEELDVIKKLKLKKVKVRFPKKYSTTKIINNIKKYDD